MATVTRPAAHHESNAASRFITKADPRFINLNKANNARYPVAPAQAPAAVAVCQHAEDVAVALQHAVSAGKRPTIRAGGNCYEDFYINNPDGVLIDLANLNFTGALPNDPRFHIGPGATMGKTYTDLYRLFNVTIPGASCSGVTAGGHIVGGGYGFLSRLHGTTADWVSEVSILTVDSSGVVIPRTVNTHHDPDLFRACRGVGGGNFGIITDYIFDKLPTPPTEVIITRIQFSWDGMTEEKFGRILNAYGNYFATRGKDPDTWGLFTIFGLSHKHSGGFGISAQFCNPDGTCKDLTVLNEFLALFDFCADSTTTTHSIAAVAAAPTHRDAQLYAEDCAGCHGGDGKGGDGGTNIATTPRVAALSDGDLRGIVHNGTGTMPGFALPQDDTQSIVRYLRSLQNENTAAAAPVTGSRRTRGNQPPQPTLACGQHNLIRTQWFATDGSGSARGGDSRQRAKYKSCYMRKNFTPHEIATYYKHLTRTVPGIIPDGATISIDSYGGAVNRKEMSEQTVIYARNSVMKIQMMIYWTDPAEDSARIAFLNELYKDLYTSPEVSAEHQGTPYPGENYEGCFICYPDSNLLEHPWWADLYYGPNYKFLQAVKRRYDPNNIFHHSMSVRAT